MAECEVKKKECIGVAVCTLVFFMCVLRGLFVEHNVFFCSEDVELSMEYFLQG